MDPLNSQSLVLLVLVSFILLYSSSSLNCDTCAHAAAAAANLANSSTDLQALLSFKSLLSDPQQALASWNYKSLHYCHWPGVTCSRNNPGRVVALDLDSLHLSGTISPYIGNLTFLTRVHLPNNSLQGYIPRELGKLLQLQHLNLSINALGGSIPDTLSQCSLLQNVSLHDNKLEGPIPPTLSRCLNLQVFSLHNNILSGDISEEFAASLPKLAYLDLSNNALTGNVPTSLGSNSELIKVDLSKNQLTGGIPASLWNISSLAYVDLSYNFLTGSIPPFLTTLSNLHYLSLSNNSLSGAIPSSLGSQSSIQCLYLANNRLEESIPVSLADISNLIELDLSINFLSGQVPLSLYNLIPLSYLGVGDNKLKGNIPQDIGHTLPNIQYLIMQSNQFDGPIPTSLLNATRLKGLYLSNNSFSGLIPSDFGSLKNLRRLELGWNHLEINGWNFLSSLSSCSQLERLILEDNQIEGILPASVGNLSANLQWLMLGKNKIHGQIPEEIGNLVGLRLLYLDQTHVTGRIPEIIGNLHNLYILNLSWNLLTGSIPSSIGNLTQLNELYMQDNQLSSKIPATLGNLLHLVTLDLSYNALDGAIPEELVTISSLSSALDLSHNSLSGSMPLQVGSLTNLLSLDVSYNQLSGEIPNTLGDCVVLESLRMENNYFTGKVPESFKDLRSLQELDLSSNNLYGQIPEILENMTYLQYLNLSFNDLEGEVPLGGAFNNASEVSFVGNRRLCGGNPMLQLPPCKAKSISHVLKMAIPVSTLVLILIFCLTRTFCYRCRVAGEKTSPVSGFEHRQRSISYTEISRATNGFSRENLVGTGSFGSVYKANMDLYEGTAVVVKVFDLVQTGGLKSFIAECEALRNIRHRNLIKIITACSSVDSMGNDFKALMFEYMPNGSLDEWLHPSSRVHLCRNNLNLKQRLNIAADVASALCYMHHSCVVPVVHCDLKPSNVLLDNEMVAHVGDFGLARFLTSSVRFENSASSMRMKGSIGYIAPEYAMCNRISTQGDVYSYGVLLLEMLTGKRPTDATFRDGLNLHKYVELALHHESWGILDPALFQEEGENATVTTAANASVKKEICINSLARLGLLCSKESPKERITMEDVAAQLQAIKEMCFTVETTTMSIVS